MTILNKSQTDKQSKDYWRTPFNLVDDALKLLSIDAFDIDVCCKDESVKIPVCILVYTRKSRCVI